MNRALSEVFQIISLGLSLMHIFVALLALIYGSEYVDAPIYLVLCGIYYLLMVIVLDKCKK